MYICAAENNFWIGDSSSSLAPFFALFLSKGSIAVVGHLNIKQIVWLCGSMGPSIWK